MAIFPGYYTGTQGIIKFDTGAIAHSEFSVDITRGVATSPRGGGKYSDLNVPGKVGFSGTLKRIMIGGEIIESLIGTGDPSSNATAGAVSVGAATTFTFIGMAETQDASSNITITAANCFFTKSSFTAGDADTIITEEVEFMMMDPDDDLTTEHTTSTS
ncbi:MAG: hypothetical protein SVM80_13720 [Halobacteriota archaeon]|nr:hypothetical protein [Halobacteriota archaeon]